MGLVEDTKSMIDRMKTICSNYGLGNTGEEYEVITSMFLYKFLNDKFLYEIRKDASMFTNLSFAELEKKLNQMSEQEFENIATENLSAISAKLKRENFISNLYNKQNIGNFHELLDNTLMDIADNNIDIFSGRTGAGTKLKLFKPISPCIKDIDKKDDFAKALIDTISKFTFESAFKQTYDFFATIFEYLIKDYNKDNGEYGEYYTPHSIATIIASILVPNGDKNVIIYDPSAGTGTLLLALAHQIGDDKCTIYSQDIAQKSNELLRLNLILNNLVGSLPNIIRDNTLTEPFHKRGNDLQKFDYIVSNPPFTTDFSAIRDILASEAHRNRFFAGVPNIPNKNKRGMAIYLMFIQHILYSLNDKGRGAIVVPTGFLTAVSGIPLKIREYIISHKILQGVISMPSNVFANTGTNVSILFLDKSISNEQIMLIDASKLGEIVKEDKNQKTCLRAEDISLIVDTFNSKVEKDDFSILVSNEEIKNKKYSFSPGQYFDIKIEYVKLTAQEFAAKMQDFQTNLDTLFQESSKLEIEIKKQLEGITYVNKDN